MNKNKFTEGFQKQWENNHFFNHSILDNIDKEVQLHNQVSNVKSSAASCINVLGNLGKKKLPINLCSTIGPYSRLRKQIK